MNNEVTRNIAIRVRKAIPASSVDTVNLWLVELIDIQAQDLPTIQKFKKALRVTQDREVAWVAAKAIAVETKRLGWDERGKTARLSLAGCAVGMAIFGGQNAGIAALGTAVGVPLWIVSGAGVAFAKILYDGMIADQREADQGRH